MAHTSAYVVDRDKMIPATGRVARQPSENTMPDGEHGTVEELGLAATTSTLVQEGEKESFSNEVQYHTMGWFQAGAGKSGIFSETLCMR